MLKAKRFIPFTLLLAFLLSTSVMAGPRHSKGDPDIVEGIRTRDGVRQVQMLSAPQAPVIIDIPFLGRIVLVRQAQRETQDNMSKRLSAASPMTRKHR
jgi:hypothetical protein